MQTKRQQFTVLFPFDESWKERSPVCMNMILGTDNNDNFAQKLSPFDQSIVLSYGKNFSFYLQELLLWLLS